VSTAAGWAPLRGGALAASLACVVAFACGGRSDEHAPRRDYRTVAERVSDFVTHEMADKAIPAVSIALVDDQDIVWAQGFGTARRRDTTPAGARTVYRVGSVSKLFTDLAVMQLVERGTVALDSPVTTYLPDFHPANPFGTPITVRELMTHRSGLVREPPVGNYFDATDPSLAATVGSLDSTALVYAPGTRTKYSNAGVAVAGLLLERVTGQPFAPYVARAVLAPLRMERSGFVRDSIPADRRADGRMWTYHGDPFDAPTFDLGMAPAGSLYAPVTDLAWFLTALFAGGLGERGRVLADSTLEAMFAPQFAPDTAHSGFGIGFAVDQLDGQRRIGHGGAIYGFSTQLAALPDQRIGVAVAASLDVTNAVVDRIADYALRAMLAQREGRPIPDPERTDSIPSAVAARAAGTYARGAQRVELVRRGDSLLAWVRRPGLRVRLRMLGDTLVVDDRLWYGPRVRLLAGGIVFDGDTLARVADARPTPAPARWRGLIGEYGPDYDVVYVLERGGTLHALVEWFFLYPLTEVTPNIFAFPDWGLYAGERLTFTRTAGRGTAVRVGGVTFSRRKVGTEAGVTFRIVPQRPVADLRREALAATPPTNPPGALAPDLVELRSLDPTIHYDIRYAGTDNFVGVRFYTSAHAFLQRPAAEALVRAGRQLAADGLGLLIHDAYRPWFVTRMFWDATPDSQRIFVADPSQGSRHNRGAAVDLSLYDLRTGRPVEMVGGYDEMSDRSFPQYPGGTSLEHWYRERLRAAMETQGFRVYRYEWWHFDYQGWDRYPIMNVRFEELPSRR
jgi:CubicO group peptidase (beta-lactamase class C family)/D-alanyl-D-alanine dipeptidase